MLKTTITTEQVKSKLDTYLREIENKNTKFIISKAGKPSAALISIDELEDILETNNPRIKEQIMKTEEEIKKGEYITLDEL
jgi:prevent-host-death family protein